MNHGLLVVHVPVKGLVLRIDLGIQDQIVVDVRGLVHWNLHQQLSGSTQTVPKSVFIVVLCWSPLNLRSLYFFVIGLVLGFIILLDIIDILVSGDIAVLT